MNKVSNSAVLLVLGFLLGCIMPGGVRPLGLESPITKRSVEFVVQGSTSKKEITENFGPPTIQIEQNHTIAYIWQIERGGVYFVFPFAPAGLVIPLKDSHLHYRIYAVQFDDHEIVRQAGFLEIPQADRPAMSLEQYLQRWVESKN